LPVVLPLLQQEAPVVETAQVALAPHATAEPHLLRLILLLHAPDIPAGVNLAVSALPELKAVVTLTLNSTTPMALMMLAFGRSIALTGVSATVVLLHAQLMPTLLAPRRSGHGEETPGNIGPPVESVAAAQELLKQPSFSKRVTLKLQLLFTDS
jgi:hypothetical protein